MAEYLNDQQAGGSVSGSSPDSNRHTVAEYLGTIRKHIVTLIVTFVLVVVAACVFTAMSPVKYSTTTKLFAKYDSSSSSLNSAEQNSANSYIMSQIKSYPTLTTTQAVLQPVIEELHLNQTVNGLAGQITASNPTSTAFVNITVTSGNPKQAAEIANATAASLSNVVEKSLYTSGSQSAIKLSIVQPAQQPTVPSSPNWKFNVAAGVLAGLVVGVFMTLVKDKLSKTIQNEGEINEYIDAPIIGRVVEDPLLEDSKPVVVNEPGSSLAEDFRRIRTSLAFMAPVEGTNCRLLVITSAEPSEGKTTTSVNVAAALAENGAKVLLVDADLRHPSVANKLDIDGSAGLAHVLSGQASVKDVVQRYWRPNLHIMPAGPKPPNASTLLNSVIMTELLNNALQKYDYVIIDTAPMVVANDAVIFVRRGGALVMVCRRDKALKNDLEDIRQELDTLDQSVSGVIFNCAKENKKIGTVYGNYYYLSEQDEKKKKKNRFFKK